MVQSVSTPACHAGGRRFESVRGRQNHDNFRKKVVVILFFAYTASGGRLPIVEFICQLEIMYIFSISGLLSLCYVALNNIESH